MLETKGKKSSDLNFCLLAFVYLAKISLIFGKSVNYANVSGFQSVSEFLGTVPNRKFIQILSIFCLFEGIFAFLDTINSHPYMTSRIHPNFQVTSDNANYHAEVF